MAQMRHGFTLNFVEHATRRTNRIYVPKFGHFILDMTNADGDQEIVEFDFSTLPANTRWQADGVIQPEGYPTDWDMPDYVTVIASLDDVIRYGGPTFWAAINWYHAVGSTPTFSRWPETYTYPAYPRWDSSSQAPLTPTIFYSEETLPYATQQKFATAELEKWRKQKRVWLSELEQRSDLNPDLVKHGGYWLRAADAALQIEFQDPDVKPAVVAQMTRLAMKGAADIDTADEFAENLNTYTSLFPNGPDRPVLWVTKGEGNGSLSEVEQLDLADSHQYPAGTLPSDYNPITMGWIVENQPGVATVDSETPAAGTTVTVTVMDNDGIVGSPTYQWQRNVSDIWVDMAGATSAGYAISLGETSGTQIRCLVSYTDNYGPNQSAVSPIVTIS